MSPTSRLPGELHCVLVRSPHAHARIRGIDTARAAALARRRRGAHRRRHGGRQGRPDGAAVGDHVGRRQADGRAAALCAGARRGAPRRRSRSRRDRRDARAGAGCRRAVAVDYEPLPAVVDSRAALRAGAPQLHDVRARQCLLPLRSAATRPRCGKAFERRRPRGAARPRQQPPDRRGDRAARGAGRRRPAAASSRSMSRRRCRITSAAWSPSSSACRRPRSAWSRPTSAAASATRASTIPRRRSSPGAARRLRRPVKWVAHPQRMLRLRQPGPRPPHPRRAGARRGGTLPRAARRHRRQSRRLCLDLRRRHSERDLQRAARRRLPHAGDLVQLDRRVHQHAADRRLSRRRPAGGLLRAGAARRRGGAHARPRPRRDPPAQSRAGRGHAVQDADRPDLRLRRFPEGVRARCSSSRTTTGFAERRAAAERARQAARLRHGAAMSNPPASRRRALPPRSARAPASSRRRTSGCSRTAACRRCSAPTTTARATPPPSRRSSLRGSACRWRRSRSSRATPTRCRTAPARSARARSRSAARRSTAPR